jgi:hypothetical protein
LKNIVFVLVLLLSSLNAKEIYIKVMSVHSSNLFGAVYDLESLGYKSYTTEYEDLHRVYAGPFSSRDEANNALLVIRENISADAFISSLTTDSKEPIAEIKSPLNTQVQKELPTKPQDEVVTAVDYDEAQQSAVSEVDDFSIASVTEVEQVKYIQEEQSYEQEPQLQESKEKFVDDYNYLEDEYKDFFVGLNIGISKQTIKQSNISGNLILGRELEDSGFLYGLEGGYNFNRNFFITLNYQHTDSKDTVFDTLFTSLNYKFDKVLFFYPYIGALGGYSRMTWENYPIVSMHSDNEAKSFVGGAQVGSEIPIAGDVSIYLLYRYWLMTFKTNVSQDANSKEIKHENEQNINLGVKYSF